MRQKKFQYRGNLAETTLPEMLYSIDRFRVPGVVEATRRNVVKRVYIRDGYIFHALSNDRNDSLGVHLRRSGKLSLEQFERIARAREATTKRFGVLLIEEGLLSPAEVFESIREQIEGIVWSLFYWQQGEVTFSVGDYKEDDMVQILLSLSHFIFHGIKQAPDAKSLLARMGNKETILEPCYRLEELVEIGLDRIDYDFLTLVDGKRTLYELCSSGPHAPAENAKLLYAFVVLHLVRTATYRKEAGGPVRIQLKTSGDAVPH